MSRQILLTFLFILPSILFGQTKYKSITGTVKLDHKGIADVVMTDGVNFSKTDSDGNYSLLVSPSQDYVYYTLPSGAESPIEDGVPVFYKKISDTIRSYDFQLTSSPVSQKKHMFIVWADPQVIDPKEFKLLDEVVADINKTRAEYKKQSVHAISCGDIVFDRLHLFDDYKKTLTKFDFPFYQAIGNHDMDYSNQTHESSVKTYQEKFGPAYFSFNKGNVHYIVMDDVFYYGYAYHYIGYFDQKQLDWLKNDLSYVPKGSTIMLSMHIPTMYCDADAHPSMEKFQKAALMNNRFFYSYLKGYNAHILAGHSHTQWNTLISDSLIEHTHGAASAAWWQGTVGLDGTPRGYTVYEVDGNQLKWHFKAVNNSTKYQFKLYPVGADQDNPDSFIANVFNYDPQWKVVWYENNVLKGEMKQYWGVDPLARKLYPPGQNKQYSWLSYDKTNHVFKAIPTQKNAKIKVVVTDRFGNVYTEQLNNTSTK